jgi:cobalt/nickel transport system ATP-binding protein
MEMAIFDLIDVSYTYPNGRTALESVSLSVYEGEVLGVIGPNGAGKSTLLLIMSLLITPTSGEILFKGESFRRIMEDESKIYDFRRRVQLVFQDPDVQLFSSTVKRDVEFGPMHLKSGKELERSVSSALRLMEIEHLADRHPYELSGGEKRRAAIASVLSIDPEVILMDEPTADLDIRGREILVELIQRMRRKKTFVISSQDADFILRTADRVILLNKKVMFSGDPEEALRFARGEMAPIEMDAMKWNLFKSH